MLELSPPYRVVCLVGRQPGLVLLQWALDRTDIDVVGVFTHSLLPSADDFARGPRPEFPAFQRLAKAHRRPVRTVDYYWEAERMDGLLELEPFDFLLSLNWKFLVPAHALRRSRVADINLHRGKLPEYAGLEPVRRMLTDGLDHATITAHVMDEVYDQGPILCSYQHPVSRETDEPVDVATERVKRELVEHYPHCAADAMNMTLRRLDLPTLRESAHHG